MTRFLPPAWCCSFGILLASASGQNAPRISQVLPVPDLASAQPEVVDTDDDGLPDVVFATSSPACKYQIANLGGRRFAPPRLTNLFKTEGPAVDSGTTLGNFTGATGLDWLVVENDSSLILDYSNAKRPVAVAVAAAGGYETRRVLAPDSPYDWFGVNLDGDASSELIQFERDPAMLIWDRQADGSYAQTTPRIALDAAVTPGDPHAGTPLEMLDIDHDGAPDLVVSEGPGSARLLKRTGARSFATQTYPVSLGWSGNGWHDLNGDNLPECHSVSGTTFQWKPNLGGLQFGAVQSHQIVSATATGCQLLNVTAVAGGNALLTFGVLDAQSAASLLTVRFGTWEVVANLSVGSSPALGTIEHFLSVADFDGDGYLDALALYVPPSKSGWTTRLAMAWGSAVGLATPVFINPPPMRTDVVLSGDFDRDGDTDLIVGPDTDLAYFLLSNDGAGNFSRSRQLAELAPPAGSPPNTRISRLGSADVDGDGIADLIVTYTPGLLAASPSPVSTVAKGRGDGTFAPPVLPAGSFDYLRDAAVDFSHFVDWDGDGDLDAVGDDAWWDNRGGVFATESHPLIAGALIQDALGNPVRTGHGYVGDLNGDGFPDFIASVYRHIPSPVVGEFGSSTLAVGFNDGLGGLLSLAEVPATLGGTDVLGNPVGGKAAVADLNGDGQMDLCTLEVVGSDALGNPVSEARWRRNPGGGRSDPQNWLALSLGPAVSSDGIALPFPDSPTPTLDFDGDGIAEWVSPAGYLRPSRAGPVVSAGYNFDGKTGVSKLEYRGAADFDGDGDADFLVSKSDALFLIKNLVVDERSAIVQTLRRSGVTGKLAAAGADADGDGRDNFTELLQGTNPVTPDRPRPDRLQPRVTTQGGPLTVRFHQRSDAAALGLHYQLESSTDLTRWTPVVPANRTTTTLDSTWQEIAVTPAARAAQGFFRLVVRHQED